LFESIYNHHGKAFLVVTTKTGAAARAMTVIKFLWIAADFVLHRLKGTEGLEFNPSGLPGL